MPNAVKQRTATLGRCSGPFYLHGDDDIVQYVAGQDGQSILPKVNNINGVSSRSIITLRNATNLPWWPSILKFEQGALPDSMIKSPEPITSVGEWAPMTAHCSTSPAVFVLSEPARIKRRAEIREAMYNTYDMKNVFFVLANHKQENQQLETQLDMETRVYGDVIVGDFPNDQHESATKKIVLSLNSFIRNCVSQIVTVMDDSVNLKAINFDFRPKDESIYCHGGSTDKSEIPDDPKVWPFGFQIPVRCKNKHMILRRQSAKGLATSMLHLNMTGFHDPFVFASGIARTTTSLKIDQMPTKPTADLSETSVTEPTKVLLSTMQGTDMGELMNILKESQTMFALSDPTAQLFGADQRKYYKPSETKLQLAMATQIIKNGFACQFKPQSMIIQDYVKKNGSDALTRKDAEYVTTGYAEFHTNAPYDEQKRQSCSSHSEYYATLIFLKCN